MLDVKKVASTMTLLEFEQRFIKDFQGVEDTETGKTHYCPIDLGFRFTLDDCTKRSCSKCWEKAKRTLRLRESLIIGGR
jgi:hypothetical protein